MGVAGVQHTKEMKVPLCRAAVSSKHRDPWFTKEGYPCTFETAWILRGPRERSSFPAKFKSACVTRETLALTPPRLHVTFTIRIVNHHPRATLFSNPVAQAAENSGRGIVPASFGT